MTGDRGRLIQQRAEQTQTFLDGAQDNLLQLDRSTNAAEATALIATAQAQAALASVVALTRIAEALEAAA